ncbi:hypothetical protein IFM89_018506 [Coptis chinensis]|uniref:F-box protein n=1 Tax=Coptis chinensis TaxID=261450 RepID=A0A835IPU4_9MAGN|nr:hypothetical protein IFM89_018506 [Coptis chinensis]
MVELPLPEEGGGSDVPSFHYLISSSDGCITKKSVPGELVIELLSYLPIKSVCKVREPSWRTIEPFDQYHTLLKDPCTAPLVNGALHWRAIRIPLPQSRVILSFDLKEEVFKEIPHPYPTELIFKDVYLELVELGGLLSERFILIQSSLSSTKKIVFYNAETNSVRDVKIFDSDHWKVFAYTRSLILPKFISGLNHNRT